MYDTDTLRHVWRVGAAPLSLTSEGAHAPLLRCLGDTAVDFDIAPPRVAPQSTEDFRSNTSLINVRIYLFIHHFV